MGVPMGYAITAHFFYGIWLDVRDFDLVAFLKPVIKPSDWDRKTRVFDEDNWYRNYYDRGLRQLNTNWEDDIHIGGQISDYDETTFFYLAIKSTHHQIEAYETGHNEFSLPSVNTKAWDNEIHRTCKMLGVKYNPPKFFLEFTRDRGAMFFYGMEIEESVHGHGGRSLWDPWKPPEELPAYIASWPSRDCKVGVMQLGRYEEEPYTILIPATYDNTEHTPRPFDLPCSSKPKWDGMIREKCEAHDLPWKSPSFCLEVFEW